jgi:F-box-like
MVIEAIKRQQSGVNDEILVHMRNIEEFETNIRELEVKIKQSKNTIADLELIREDLHEDLADAKLTQGPWRPSRLPLETLREIFHYYIDLPLQSSWQLAHICRAWRRVALGCPSLWNKVRFSTYRCFSPLPGTYVDMDSARGEWVATRLQMRRALRRTKSAPISIKLDLWWPPRSNITEVEDILHLLGRDGLSRCRSLRFKLEVTRMWIPAVKEMLQGDTSSLRSLMISSTNCPALLPFLNLSQLSSLTILVNGKLKSFQASLDSSWLSGLKKLSFKGRIKYHRLISTIVQCQALEELGIHPSTPHVIPGESLLADKWPPLPSTLRIVRLRTHANFWLCITGLKITNMSLSLTCASLFPISLPHRSISLPCLTDLYCHAYGTIFAAGYLLDAPKLHSLRVYHRRDGEDEENPLEGFREFVWEIRPDQVDICTSGTHDVYHRRDGEDEESPLDGFREFVWGIRPNQVDIYTSGTHDVSLLALLRRLVDVERLTLVCGPQTATALRILAPNFDNTNAVICPRLEHVQCKLDRRVSPGEAETINGIRQEVQQARELLGLSRPVINLQRVD